MKKRFTLILALCLAFSVTVSSACGALYEDEVVGDTTKTILYVANYTAGFGSKWIEDAERNFEEKYKDVSFEDGKKGVDVVLDLGKIDAATHIEFGRDHIVLSESLYYSAYASRGLLAKIDDLLTADGSEFGDSGTIWDKMPEYIRNGARYADGSYYALPTYFTGCCFNYNLDLFDEYKLYFAADKDNGNHGFIINDDDDRSNGPDGVAGTYDDGFPATYDEFYKLCDRMLDFNITPITWGEGTYVTALLTNLWADYEGDDMPLNFDFNGRAHNLIKSIDAESNLELEELDITNANGCEIYRQAGRYYALKFLETCIHRGYVNPASLSSSSAYSYLTAQSDFITSGIAGKKSIGMLVEGYWWNNEASSTFNELATRYGQQYSRENMRFGIVPFPKATEAQVGQGCTTVDGLVPMAVITSRTKGAELEVAKLFYRYMFSDENLKTFTRYTGVPWTYDYDINEVTANTYAKSVQDLFLNSKTILPMSSSPLFLSNLSYFGIWFYAWDTIVNGKSYSYITPFIDKTVTAEQYFNGIYTLHKSSWNTNFADFI